MSTGLFLIAVRSHLPEGVFLQNKQMPSNKFASYRTGKHFHCCKCAEKQGQGRNLLRALRFERRKLPGGIIPRNIHSVAKIVTQNRKTLGSVVFGAVVLFCTCFKIQQIVKKRKNDQTISESEELHEKFVMPHTKNLVLFKRKGHWIPYDFINSDNQLHQVRKFKVRPTDVFVVSFPKSGTTWVQEIVLHIMNYNKDRKDERNMDDRFPYLEFVYPGIKELDKLADQRCLKSHVQFDALPLDVLSGRGKVIYVARNVKDVTVSMYHFYKLITTVQYTGPFTEFCHIFNEGKVAYGPYWKHVAEYWKERKRPNFLFIKYEDLQKDAVTVIMKMAEFLGKPLDEKQARTIAVRCSFRNMKNNPHTNYNWHKFYGILDNKGDFMRKGEVGDWRNYYTPALVEETDAICADYFYPIGLDIPDKI